MDQDQFLGLFSIVAVVSVLMVLAFRQSNRGKKRILLTDYRRGVHFVDGTFKIVLGPGSYRYDSRNEQINVVDMRPQPVVIERFAFQDALSHEGVISIGTQLLVRDPRLAATTLRDQIKDAYVILRDTVRLEMSKQVAATRDNAAAVADAIAKAANTELAKFGMGVTPIDVTELWSHPGQPRPVEGSTTIQ